MGEPGAGRTRLSTRPDGADPAARWSALHHGIDPAAVPLLRPWLRTMWWLARPLVRLRVPPTAITVAGVLLAIGAVLVVDGHPWAAGVAVLLSVVCDGVDGAVAVLADRATRGGAIADAVGDRVCELAFAAVVWRCGAPVALAVTAGALSLALDLVRRARSVPARLTVGERPTTAICTLLACASASVSEATGSEATWPATVCATVWVAATVTGLVQLLGGGRR